MAFVRSPYEKSLRYDPMYDREVAEYLKQFRNEKGYYTRWVHIFETAVSDDGYRKTAKVYSVCSYPWVFNSDTFDVDLVFATAAIMPHGLSYFPGEWPSFERRVMPTKLQGLVAVIGTHHDMDFPRKWARSKLKEANYNDERFNELVKPYRIRSGRFDQKLPSSDGIV